MASYDDIDTSAIIMEDYEKTLDSQTDNTALQGSELGDKEVTPTEAPQSQPTEPQLYEYVANGKTVKEPLEMILKRAGMGYHYAQQMDELRRQQASLAEIQKQNETLAKWKQYDDYARENPQWAQHVQDMWTNKSQYSDPQMDPTDPMSQRFSKLEQMLEAKLSGLDSKFQTYDNFIKSQTEAKEDSALSSEIQSIRQSYPNIDFTVTNEQGKSLEYQVLEHMRDNQIPSFRAGFRDFYHDKLIETEKLKAKETVASGLQKSAKAGVLSKATTPHGSALTPNIGKLNYDQLAEMAKADWA